MISRALSGAVLRVYAIWFNMYPAMVDQRPAGLLTDPQYPLVG
jgi:hypothetical protein